MSRLSIELTEQQHQSIKALAALQGKSIKEYAIERLLPATEDEELVMRELKAMLNHRIGQALAGNVVHKTIEEIVEDELSKDATE